MINADMRQYDFFTLGEENEYKQATISKEPKGKVLMAINIASQSVQDNIYYKECQYVGLTRANVDDTYIIGYRNEKLKVLYVNPKGRMKQVFMKAL